VFARIFWLGAPLVESSNKRVGCKALSHTGKKYSKYHFSNFRWFFYARVFFQFYCHFHVWPHHWGATYFRYDRPNASRALV